MTFAEILANSIGFFVCSLQTRRIEGDNQWLARLNKKKSFKRANSHNKNELTARLNDDMVYV